MATIKKMQTARGVRYKVEWSWYDSNGQRVWRNERFLSETAAKAKKRDVEREVADGQVPDYAGGKKPLSYWAERWYESKSKRIKPATAHGYRLIIDNFLIPEFGNKRVRSITTTDVQEWIDGMGVAPPTIRHRHRVLRAIFNHAVRANAIRGNPAQHAELPTDRSIGRAKPEYKFLTPEEVGRLSAALSDLWPYDLLVVFTAYTGLRAAEVAGLDVGDLDLMRRRVYVRRTRSKINGEHLPKNGKVRRVPMPQFLVEDMRDYLGKHPRGDDSGAPLFPGRKHVPQPGGQRGAMDWEQPYNHEVFYRRMWVPATKAAEVHPMRFHDLRHTYASLMASVGAKPHEVAEWLGHGDANITLAIYTHVWPDASDAYADLHQRPPAPKSADVTTLDTKRNQRTG